MTLWLCVLANYAINRMRHSQYSQTFSLCWINQDLLFIFIFLNSDNHLWNVNLFLFFLSDIQNRLFAMRIRIRRYYLLGCRDLSTIIKNRRKKTFLEPNQRIVYNFYASVYLVDNLFAQIFYNNFHILSSETATLLPSINS